MVDIVFTGGGTAGHVTPNLALVPDLRALGYQIAYIGQDNSIEKSLVEREQIDFYSIPAGKLRRYIDFQNLTDLFRILAGLLKALLHLTRLRPKLVFSKGGFVSCPVVWAAWLLRIPVIIHESDITPGLANKLSRPFAKIVCYSFPETEKYLSGANSILTGVAIRDFLGEGQAENGRKLCGFSADRPTIVIIGGSQGSRALNKIVRNNLQELCENYNVCHLCGKGELDNSLEGSPAYKQFEYLNEELPDVFAMADLVISRAGATSIFELLSLQKPNILIPLPLTASRGDQILNAESFEKLGFSLVAQEESMKEKQENFLSLVEDAFSNAESMKKNMAASEQNGAKEKLISLIRENT